ncbi:hypothetical protein FS749_012204 [Ceratobasidium sp. UAMH 11750]|nr:hypothetical protein FS749_012204 [Ceratobasidium sp. UAMH 11750]
MEASGDQASTAAIALSLSRSLFAAAAEDRRAQAPAFVDRHSDRAGTTQGKKKARGVGNRKDQEPNLSFVEILRRMRARLDGALGERDFDNAHLWFIQELLTKLSAEESRKLHWGAWWYFQDLSSAVGTKDHSSFGSFLEMTRGLYEELRKHVGSVHDFANVLEAFILNVQVRAGEFRGAYELTSAGGLVSERIAASGQRVGQRKERNAAKEAALSVVGNKKTPVNEVLMVDIDTKHELRVADLIAPLSKAGVQPKRDSIPPGAVTNAHSGFVSSDDLEGKGFKIYGRGTIYFFWKAPDGFYHFVLGAMWRDMDEVGPAGKEHLDNMTEWAELGVKEAYHVTENEAQNAGDEKGE